MWRVVECDTQQAKREYVGGGCEVMVHYEVGRGVVEIELDEFW